MESNKKKRGMVRRKRGWNIDSIRGWIMKSLGRIGDKGVVCIQCNVRLEKRRSLWLRGTDGKLVG